MRQETLVELEIEGLAAGGRGVARQGGKVWFVAGGLPGDRVQAETIAERPRFVEARSLALLRPSSDRRPAPCPVQSRCGGCPWMTLDPVSQREWKRRLVEDALRRIGGQQGIEVRPVLRAGEGLGYRNKVELALGRERPGGRPVIGFHRAGSASAIVDVEHCAVQHQTANDVLTRMRSMLLRDLGWAAAFDGTAPTRLILRRSWHTGEILVAIREYGVRFPEARRFGETLVAADPRICGVVRLVAPPGRRGGTRVELLAGRDRLEERIGELTFELPAASFTQVGTEVASEMIRWIVAHVGPGAGRRALDLYGGIGTIGLHLAANGFRVAIAEADRDAVECGKRAALRAGLSNAELVASDVRNFLAERKEAPREDLVVANPPRGGLDRGVVAAILERRPPTLVLVSCDPATLARDLRGLVEGGYRADAIQPVDMFPQTAHVETLALLHAPGH